MRIVPFDAGEAGNGGDGLGLIDIVTERPEHGVTFRPGAVGEHGLEGVAERGDAVRKVHTDRGGDLVEQGVTLILEFLEDLVPEQCQGGAAQKDDDRIRLPEQAAVEVAEIPGDRGAAIDLFQVLAPDLHFIGSQLADLCRQVSSLGFCALVVDMVTEQQL